MKETSENRVVYFAEADFKGERVSFGIKAKDCLRPVVIIGGNDQDRSALLETFNKNFSKILSETGDDKTGSVMAGESLKSLSKEAKNFIFNKIGTIIALRLVPEDAKLLNKIFAPSFSSMDLQSLNQGEMCLRLMIDDSLSSPFKAKILSTLNQPKADFAKASLAKEVPKQVLEEILK